MHLEQFQRYSSWFHDGDIIDIIHNIKQNSVVITMASAQIIGWDEFDHGIPLSKDQKIVGRLHFDKIHEIKINEDIYQGTLHKKPAIGEILRLRFPQFHQVSLFILWKINGAEEYTALEIKSESVWWENVPELDVHSPLTYLDEDGHPLPKSDDHSHLYPE